MEFIYSLACRGVKKRKRKKKKNFAISQEQSNVHSEEMIKETINLNTLTVFLRKEIEAFFVYSGEFPDLNRNVTI